MKPSTNTERAVRIELLRARSALERQSLVRNVRDVGYCVQPAALMRSMFPRLASRSPAHWLMQGLALTRRYPLVASSATALLGGGKGKGLLRIAAGLLLSWQVARSMGKSGSRGRSQP